MLDLVKRTLRNTYTKTPDISRNGQQAHCGKGRARSGKTIFISTHDANIAVRTLPYSSIFRCHGPNGYRTYLGNPFSNNLLNPDDPNDQLDWRKISMKTLEGGEEAFGERGKIYGNI